MNSVQLLRGRRTIVVGGARGIGAATVLAFAEHGASVVSFDVDDEAGEAIASKARKAEETEGVTYLHCDISRQEEVDAAVDQAVRVMGGLDCMVVVAGIEQQKPAAEVTQADIDSIFAVNVNGTMFTNAAAFRHLREHGGSIVNYSAGSGIDGFPGMPVYAASKGAVLAYTRTVAKDWGRFGIRVNAIAPAVMTPLMEEFRAGLGPEGLKAADRRLRSLIPLGGKPGPPEDAADVNVFFASELSRFVTGQTVPVDGGYTMVR